LPAPRAIEHDWFLFIDPTNHIKSLGEQASCFVRFEHGQWIISFLSLVTRIKWFIVLYLICSLWLN